MNRRWMILLLAVTAGIIAVACGSDDDGLGTGRVSEAAPTAVPTTESTEAPSVQVNTFDPGTACPTARQGGPRVEATPGIGIDQGANYEAIIKTSKGDIRIELFDDEAPITVNNFIHLSRCGYYNGTKFHRVLPAFMAQSGDPTGTGSGSPGYTIVDEFSPNLRHSEPGALSMANAGFGTGGSQFFITRVPTPRLDGYAADGTAKLCQAPPVSCHAVFGQVISGQDVVDSLNDIDPSQPKPDDDPEIIKTIEIVRS